VPGVTLAHGQWNHGRLNIGAVQHPNKPLNRARRPAFAQAGAVKGVQRRLSGAANPSFRIFRRVPIALWRGCPFPPAPVRFNGHLERDWK